MDIIICSQSYFSMDKERGLYRPLAYQHLMFLLNERRAWKREIRFRKKGAKRWAKGKEFFITL